MSFVIENFLKSLMLSYIEQINIHELFLDDSGSPILFLCLLKDYQITNRIVWPTPLDFLNFWLWSPSLGLAISVLPCCLGDSKTGFLELWAKWGWKWLKEGLKDLAVVKAHNSREWVLWDLDTFSFFWVLCCENSDNQIRDLCTNKASLLPNNKDPLHGHSCMLFRDIRCLMGSFKWPCKGGSTGVN